MKRLTAAALGLLICFSPAGLTQDHDFRAPWWCRGGHWQTICGGLFGEKPFVTYRRERFELPDGDFLDLDWLDGESGKPVLLILHGLASNSASAYIRRMADEAHELGWTAVVMNARGQSGEPNRLRGTNHAGRSEDAAYAVAHVLEKTQTDSLYLLGYSLGGNILLKWLGENAGFIPPQVKKAAAVSAAYDLTKVAGGLDRDWFDREVYVREMLKVLKPLATEKEKRFPGSIDLDAVMKAKTFEVYDREVTAKLNGFKNEKEYWEKSSSKNFIGLITVPTLLVHADNDPFLPGAELPYREMLRSPNLRLLLTRDGGHLGFVTGEWPWKTERWLEKEMMRFFTEPASQTSAGNRTT